MIFLFYITNTHKHTPKHVHIRFRTKIKPLRSSSGTEGKEKNPISWAYSKQVHFSSTHNIAILQLLSFIFLHFQMDDGRVCGVPAIYKYKFK